MKKIRRVMINIMSLMRMDNFHIQQTGYVILVSLQYTPYQQELRIISVAIQKRKVRIKNGIKSNHLICIQH